ncbi:hypothetical protein N658DRAFT_501580 [Parathielavia hyrcaniae]|uniref:Uncharacterized protein n=1 Tax=Parathielavia hyrcaniae TaxID=113614 RepID=A0AAN6PRL4_9PEZI|nr:hypothetical protein N658DRAFT_501580 [Parathielavia hyrcaniae]
MASAPATGLMTLFLPDSEPISLEASAIAVNTVARYVTVTTLQVACPTAASPENDACRSAGIYPAQVYHTKGSVCGGTTTYSAGDSTTTWVCTLGASWHPGLSSRPTMSGDCTKTIVAAGSTRTVTDVYDKCYVVAHQRPVVVTAGLDKINPYHYMTHLDASQYNSVKTSLLASAGCPASQTIMWAGASSESASTTASSGATTGASSESTAGSAATTTSESQTTETSPAPAAATSPSGATKVKMNARAALLAGLGLTLMLHVGLL